MLRLSRPLFLLSCLVLTLAFALALSAALPTASLQAIPIDFQKPASRLLGQKNGTLHPATPRLAAATPCDAGSAAGYPCDHIDLLSFVAVGDLAVGAIETNDIWGWTDPVSQKEYALIGLDIGTSFVDISDPENPFVVGFLATQTSSSIWRDIKTYGNYAFIVSEALGHGMQIFDLTELATVVSPPALFTATQLYTGFSNAHNVVINEDTGFAYAVGTNDCSGGLHMVNIQNPLSPANAGCFSADGYTHDAQCVTYNGPDVDHQGKEICMNNNADTVTIVDVTNKAAPVQISRTGYAGSGYTHQGWLTEDHRYYLMNDEGDESQFGHNTKTYIWDVADLDNPVLIGTHLHSTPAIDHNLYVLGNYAYEANYRAGLRIMSLADVANGNLSEVGYFDIYPGSDAAQFNGAWSVYPYFPSGVVVVSGIEQGLFVLDVSRALATAEVSGVVTLSDNPDASGAHVMISGVSQVTTGSSGDYLLSNIPGGTYDVTATKPGYESSTQSDVVVADGASVTDVDFTLQAGTSSITGRVFLCGETDHSGVLVQTSDASISTTTNSVGDYVLGPMGSGTYDIVASKTGFETQTEDGVVVGVDQISSAHDFTLGTVTEVTLASSPGTPIVDNTITDTISVPSEFSGSPMVVSVDIDHSWVGDLRIELESPAGTTITLLDRPGYTGSGFGCGDDDLQVVFDEASSTDLENHCSGSTPWYSGEAAPFASMSPWLAETTIGDWTLTVSDNASGDTGSLLTWSLKFSSSQGCDPPTDTESLPPLRFALSPPRPNPFNPATKIRFSLPEDSFVEIAVFDVAGRGVATLVREKYMAGRHEVTWLGRNDRGQEVTSGVYFVRMKALNFQHSEKVTVLK